MRKCANSPIHAKNGKENEMVNSNGGSVLDVLINRGFIDSAVEDGKETFAVTNLDKTRALLDRGTTIYEGFDPSGSSLHLGHLLSLMALHYLQEAGSRIIFLLGGATGRVGDPTDKKSTRQFLTAETVVKNAASIRKQVEGMGLLSFEEGKALMLNNDSWIAPETFLDFYMMEIARFFSVNELVKMDTFRRRLVEGKHLSLMEFLYPTLQAWDFLHLYREYRCEIQVGGKDQWANILQGISLIRAHGGQDVNVQGMTFPLLLTPSGEKMGKTEKGPLWLDPEMTSPFEFYQYIEKTPDDMVGQLFKLFTFLDLEEIEGVMAGDSREAQKRLAFEVTKIVHGEEEAEKARRHSKTLFSRGNSASVDVIPETVIKTSTTLDEVLVASGALTSRSEVRRRCAGGAIKIGGKKITDPKTVISENCTIQYGKSSFLNVTFKE